MKLTQTTWNVHGQRKPQREGTQCDLYSICSHWARVGLALGSCWARVGSMGLRVGSVGDPWSFLDTNMLASATPWGFALGYTPNAKLQRKWFHVAVEYRLNMSHDLRQEQSSCNIYKKYASTIKQYLLYSKGQECTKPLLNFFSEFFSLTIFTIPTPSKGGLGCTYMATWWLKTIWSWRDYCHWHPCSLTVGPQSW